MPIPRGWQLTLAGVFIAITFFAVCYHQLGRAAKVPLPEVRSPVATATKEAQYVSALSPDGLPSTPGSPESVRIAAARARSLFRKVRWEEFVATAEQWTGPGGWIVRIEPKSGEHEDVVWVKGEGDRVKSFGFRRKDKLMGYTGKTKKGASPGFCR